MEFQKYYLENFLIKFFFVSFLINSTEGWSYGFTPKAVAKRIVSKIKKINNSPSVFSSLFFISKLLKGIFLFLNTFSVAIYVYVYKRFQTYVYMCMSQ